MDVLDRRRAGLPEAAVDARDEELDLVALRPVLGALEPRRHEHLDHRRRPRASRILLEEALERVQLLRDPLRVVEPLDAEDEPLPLVLALELGEQPRRLRVLEGLPEALRVDPDRVDADPDRAPVDLERVRLRVDPEDPQARRAEVPRVVADLEADVVGPEHARAGPARGPAAAGTPRSRETACAGRTRSRDSGRACAGAPGRASGGSRGSTPGSPARCARGSTSAKRSFTSTYRSHASGVIRSRSEK